MPDFMRKFQVEEGLQHALNGLQYFLADISYLKVKSIGYIFLNNAVP
jgi:hypothetical protein